MKNIAIILSFLLVTPFVSAAETSGFEVQKAEYNGSEIQVSFSEDIVLPENTLEAFSLEDLEANEVIIDSMSQSEEDMTTVTLTPTSLLSPDNEYFLTILNGVKNSAGESISIINEVSIDFVNSFSTDLEEVLAEELDEGVEDEQNHPVADSKAGVEYLSSVKTSYKFNEETGMYDIELSWQEETEELKNIRISYQQNGKNFSSPVEVNSGVKSYTTSVKAGESYNFKIESILNDDSVGNNVEKRIILPETGPASILSLTVLFSILASIIIRRKNLA